MNKNIKIASLVLIPILFALPAQALRIGNCSDTPHHVQVDYYQDQIVFNLQPGEHRYVNGRPRAVVVGDEKVTIFQIDAEYCIRQNGEVSIQRRRRRYRGH